MKLKTNPWARSKARRTPVPIGALAVIADTLGASAAGAVTAGLATVNSLFPGRDRNLHVWKPTASNGPRPFEILEEHRHVRLTTYRKSGEAVGAPVWFALVDDRVYVTTPPRSAKMKRIRNDPRVLLTPCNTWGAPRGESVEGVARIVEETAPERAGTALRRRYWLGLALFRLLGQREIGQIRLEIRPTVVGLNTSASDSFHHDSTYQKSQVMPIRQAD